MRRRNNVLKRSLGAKAEAGQPPRLNFLQQALRERAPLRRKLVDSRTDVRAELPAGVREVTDLSHLRERLPVVIE